MVRRSLAIALLFAGCLQPLAASAWVKGIYITQYTMENQKTMRYLIQRSKAVGIDTFVIDYERPSRAYQRDLAMVKQANINYVARVVMFPHGAFDWQVKSQKYLQGRYNLIHQALDLGANEIQLDYIRYRSAQAPSHQNAVNIYQVIQTIDSMMNKWNPQAKLQIDIFGVAAFKESVYIGQSVPLFAPNLDAICPMVYPSHYEPYVYHAKNPYSTIYQSLTALNKQLQPHPQVHVYPYIELFNYRYPMSASQRANYMLQELKAAKDANAEGWYAWSAGNKYNPLFNLLAQYKNQY